MKKGQVTIFIIVGIVIIFSLALVVYFTALSTPEPDVEVTPADENLRTCLEQSLDLAILQLAATGGNNTVGANGAGVLIGASTTATRVHLGISAPQNVQPIFTPLQTWLGRITLEPLCLRHGPNRPNAAGTYRNDCMPGTYQLTQPNAEVLQYIIAQRTSQNAQQCGVQQPVTITFGQADVVANSGNLSVKSSARFKRMYNAAFMVALADIKDPLYDKRDVRSIPGCVEPTNNNDCLVSGLTVRSSVDSAGTATVEITDTRQKIAGTAPILRYAVENRAPVIVTLPRSSPDPSQPLAVNSNEQKEFVLVIADPDEFDTVTVTCEDDPRVVCSSVADEFQTTLTVRILGCTNQDPGEAVPVSLRFSDQNGNEQTYTLNTFLTRSSTSCS